MPEWTTALPDWKQRIINRESLIPCLPLFPDEAASALKQFMALQIVDAMGSPTMGDACRQWVFDFVEAIFGSYNSDSGRRLINQFFLLVSLTAS